MKYDEFSNFLGLIYGSNQEDFIEMTVFGVIDSSLVISVNDEKFFEKYSILYVQNFICNSFYQINLSSEEFKECNEVGDYVDLISKTVGFIYCTPVAEDKVSSFCNKYF